MKTQNNMTLEDLVKVYEQAYYQTGRKDGIKAVLEAVGWEPPIDEDRIAYDAWCKDSIKNRSCGDLFEAWKAGREEMRLKLNESKEAQEWIQWNGTLNSLPLDCNIHSVKLRSGVVIKHTDACASYDWVHRGTSSDIIAYKLTNTPDIA